MPRYAAVVDTEESTVYVAYSEFVVKYDVENRIIDEYWVVKDLGTQNYLFANEKLSKDQAERIATQLNLIIGGV